MEKKNNNGFKIILLMLIVVLIVIFGYLAYNKYLEAKDKTKNDIEETTNLVNALEIEEKGNLLAIVKKIRFMGLVSFNNGTDNNILDMNFANFSDSQIALYLLLTQDFNVANTICFTTSSSALKNCVIDDTNQYSSASEYNEAVKLSALNERAGIIFGKEINATNITGNISSYLYEGEYYITNYNEGIADSYEIKEITLTSSEEKYIATIVAESVDEENNLPDITYKFTFQTIIDFISAQNIEPISFVQEK